MQKRFPDSGTSGVGIDSIAVSHDLGKKRGGRGRRRCFLWSVNGSEDQARFGVICREVPELMKSRRENLRSLESERQFT